jgi:hypothetical protein
VRVNPYRDNVGDAEPPSIHSLTLTRLAWTRNPYAPTAHRASKFGLMGAIFRSAPAVHTITMTDCLIEVADGRQVPGIEIEIVHSGLSGDDAANMLDVWRFSTIAAIATHWRLRAAPMPCGHEPGMERAAAASDMENPCEHCRAFYAAGKR